MDALIPPLLNGTALGALLLLAALGLTLTFGQMGVINMAHGEFIMAGAFIAYLTQLVVTSSNISILLALPLAFLGAGLLGLLLEIGIIQWMYRRPLDTLLVTVGVALILQQIALQIFPAQGVPVESPDWLDGQINVLGYAWPLRQVFTIVLAALCLAALAAWLKYSSFGRRIRATVQNRDLAETSGIRTRNVDRITFFVGSGLAGVAGVAASLIGGTNSQMGTQYIIPAFLVVVAGGVGQIKGTVIAAWASGHRAVVLRRLDDRKHGASARLRARRRLPAVPPTGPVHGPHPGVDMTKLKAVASTHRHRGVRRAAPGRRPCRALHALDQQPRQVLLLGDRGGRDRPRLGSRRHAGPGSGSLLRARRLRHGDAPHAGDARGPAAFPSS